LVKAGVDVTTVVDHKFIHSIYFHDNNGISLEASVWTNNVTGKEPQFADPHLFQDTVPGPVPWFQAGSASLVVTRYSQVEPRLKGSQSSVPYAWWSPKPACSSSRDNSR